MFQLTVRGPDGSEKIYSLAADQGLLVGREEGSDIVLPSTRVSRRHARFYTTGNTLHVEDLGSQGGVFVGGARVNGPSEVRPGLPVEIGEFSIRAKRDTAFNAGDYLGTLVGTGTMQGKTLNLPIERGVVGREPPADIIIPDDSVSRKHAEVRRLPDGSFVVRDLHSSNGTMVNNAKLPADADRPLRPNDKVAFGETNWTVGSVHVGPSAEVQRSRARVLVSVGLVGVVIVGVIAFASRFTTRTNLDEGPRTGPDISLHDKCLTEINNEHFENAVALCKAAYDADPVDADLRQKLRQAQREVKNKAIYDLAMTRENADELEALDSFFQIEPASDYFAKAKIEVDRILDRQRPQLLAQCRDAMRKKGTEHQAIEPCTRYLNYTCHVKGKDPAVLALLKKADSKKAGEYQCPPALQPWFGIFGATKTADSECPKKYSDKDMAQACIDYAGSSIEEALASLTRVKDVGASAAADQLRDDINAAVGKLKAGQTQASLHHPQEARTEFDASLVLDSRIMPASVESVVGRTARDTVASIFMQAGLDDLDKRNIESAYRNCAIAYRYRSNKEGLPKCLEAAGAQVMRLVPRWDCGQLSDASGYAPPGSNFSSAVTQAMKDKHCS